MGLLLKALRIFAILMSIAPLVPAAGLATVAGSGNPEVRVSEGAVRGQVRDGVAVFRSIPYAAPPVGALRFRPPQPAKAWNGVREAIEDGPSCPQTGGGDPAAKASTNEDCLLLNVFTPAEKSSAKRPVMVWIHGGGWNGGFSGARQYDPAPLVKEGGIIVVSVNYRLGALGLLATKSLDDANGEPSGNYLIRDHQAALLWVQKNIGAFGGDPHNVTICGESAGANSILAIVPSPVFKGLFQKAIVQSGVEDAHTITRAKMEQTGEELAETLGCAAGSGQADCLRKLPVGAILKVRRKLGIVEDPQLFPVDPFVGYRGGKFNRVPMIIGSNLHEGYFFASGSERTLGHVMTEPEYVAQMKTTFGPDADAVMKQFPAKAAPSPAAAVGDAITDRRFSCYMDMARVGASKYAPVYGFEMNESDPAQQQPRPKFSLANSSYHTSDLAYLFDYDTRPLTGDAAALGKRMRGYWIQFMKTGSPNGKGLPEWPKFQSQSGSVLNLSNHGGLTSDFAVRHNCGPLEQSGLVSWEWK
jgi:para-nitrobenzyl esterase